MARYDNVKGIFLQVGAMATAPLRQSIPGGPQLTMAKGLFVVNREVPAFSPSAFISKIGAGKSIKDYKNKLAIFSQGQPADSVFYIRSGKVKLIVASKRGKEAVIAILQKGDFFGEGALAGQPLRIASASAMPRATVVRVERGAMVELLHKQPKFAEIFMAYLLSRNVRIEADLVDQLFNSSEKRLARVLLLLANFGKEAQPLPVVAKLSQETLASMIGTTRSRVSFFMNKFRKLGFLEYTNGAMNVHSSLLTVILHD
jgi:CRP/FNR family transcriptional regulator, cyclic AMP receptor protein